jgi:signal transduction histidine kinase/ligand-binding sensor domain-containing protein/CheY-like chemotaxis protein/AraC-like DNA-binding protein
MRKLWLVYLFLVMGISLSLSASASGPVTYIGMERGLSNNSVRCIYRDEQGYMWFGTYDGLNQYNGSEFKVFRNRLSDPFSLPHNYIYAITGDKDHQLLVGTGQGLVSYNPLSGRFKTVEYEVGRGQRYLLTTHVNLLKTDKNGHVFICTNGVGLMVRRAGEKVAVQATLPGNDNANVQSLTFDQQGTPWLVIGDMGLCRYDFATNDVTLVDSSFHTANAMEADRKGHLWIANSNGLFRFDVASRTAKLIHSKGFTDILALHATPAGQLWTGSETGGVKLLDADGAVISSLPVGRDGLSSEYVSAIYSDPENRVWIGTVKGGINVMDPQKGRFRTIARDPQNPNSLACNFIGAFCEDGDALYIGTDGGGLDIWNRRTNNYQHFKATPGGLSSNTINSIVKDAHGDIWIATFTGGINRYSPSTQRFKQYRCVNPLTNFENKSAWLLYIDRDGQLWATTFANGKLYRLNRSTDQFEMFDDGCNDLLSMAEDVDGTLWAGNFQYLLRIDKHSRKVDYFDIGKPVRAIHPDKSGGLWLGTEGGGLVFFKEDKIVSRFADGEGLCNNSVLNILEDGQGYLWLSTFEGLAKFDRKTNSFTTFYQGDGLQGNQFLYNAALRLQSGELAFGGINGFNIFHPAQVRERKLEAPIVLNDININNHPLINESYITAMEHGMVRALEIPYGEASFSAKFAALEYSSPEKVNFTYKLEGWDKDWVHPGQNRSITYTNIREGSYVLHIRELNTGKELLLKIKVLPPWYRTWWAWLLYVAVAVALVLLYRRYQSDRRHMRLAEKNAARQQENNERKLAFYTNIVHEFRTPLTLIINPVKDLVDDPEADTSGLPVVYRNARRLLSLVDQLLLLRKSESKAEALQLSALPCKTFCHDIYLCFAQEARARRIDYEFRCDMPDQLWAADREKMEIALYNLLSNALKFTPDGGKVIFSVAVEDENIIIHIEDNGEGIPPETGARLFDKFYQVKRSVSTTGFGIGLYLVKKFIELHHGTVTYESRVGEGTTFMVKMPLGNVDLCDADASVGRSAVLDELAAGEETDQPASTRVRKQEEVVSEKDTLLVVDDNEQMCEYIREVFAGRFHVHLASSGPQGFEMATELLPDIIISDVVMDGGDGIELCRRIKESPDLGHIPVILLSGSPSEEARRKGLEQGAEDFIPKPFEKDFLVTKVDNVLKARNSLQRYFYNEITLQQQTARISPEYKTFIDDCIALLEKHLQDEDFSVKTMAAALGMSHSKLYKRIKLVSGQTANGFIRFIRLRKAAELFINSDCNVSEAAYYVGMRDIKHFREQFNKTFGMNPSAYIEKYRQTLGKNYHLGTTVLQKRRK